MRWLRQVLAVTWVNLKSVRRRIGSSLVAVVGFAGVVAVFVAVFSIASGFARVMERGGSPAGPAARSPRPSCSSSSTS